MSSGATGSDLGTLRAVFWGLGVLGTALTWGRTVLDGTVAHLLEVLHGSHTLPGSGSALLDRFTGIPPLDYLLRTLVVFFWEAIDGSHPAVTATGIYFVGQLFPIIVAIYLDGLRHGNGSSLAKPTVWFFVFGAAAIGASGAAWALAYTAASLTTSTSVSANDLRRASLVDSPRAAGLLLPATFLGYVVPVILMGLPSPAVVSDTFRQWSIVVWNTFPLLMLVIVAAGKRVFDATIPPSSASKPQQAHLRVVRWLGAVSVAVGFALHVAVASVSASTALFPALFADKYGRELTPWALGALPLSLAGGDTVGDGIRGFMYWDQVVGYSLVLLVFLAQLRSALRFSDFRHVDWAGLTAASALFSLLLGPGTAVMAVSWLRDEILFGQQALKDEQPNKKE
ncbi:hypothetical protein VTI74DRAFT_10101 [Chaetomium olivicolor]